MKDILSACHKCTIFNDLTKNEIEDILLSVDYQVKTYHKKELICKAEDNFAKLGIIISGNIEIQKILPSGNIFCITHKNSGDLFGGSITFAKKQAYPCNVLSKTNSKILFLNKDNALKLCNNTQILSNFLQSFANGVLQFETKLELFSYSSIPKKIAFYLLHHSIENNTLVTLPSTKTAWAEYLNVSRSSLSRELKKLADDNIININRNNIVILKRKRLLALLQDNK